MTEGNDNNNEFNEGVPPPPQRQGGGSDHDGVVQDSKPAVAAAPGRILILAILAIIFVFIVIKSLFFGGSGKKVEEKPHPPEHVVEEATPPNINLKDLPGAIPVQPPPPPPPTPIPERPYTISPPPIPTPRAVDNAQLKARIHDPMIVTNGTAGKDATKDKEAPKKPSPTDPNSVFAQNIGESTVDTVTATIVKNLNRTIVQGKFIQGVLETAIDSSLPGELRAITSHDTYAESGREILIPKGSRLVGTYNSSVKRGQARVFIIWTRVIRPDGVDVQIDSPGVDALGRAGMGGDVDNKYFEAFSTAFLTSAIDVVVAGAGQAIFGNQDQIQTNGTTGTTVVTSPSSAAMQTAIQNIGTVGQSIVGGAVNLQPVIHIDQGEEINIFVNKDIVFPADLINPQIGILP